MQNLVEQLSIQLELRNWKIVVAESCTGGLIAAAITHRPGASRIFDRGYVTYTNLSKIDCLGVPSRTIQEYGAVSSQTAEAMAIGALKNSNADLSVSVTGIAGPDGGTDKKPVGLVYCGYALKNGMSGSVENRFNGTRDSIRGQAANSALKQLLAVILRENS